MFDLDYWLVFQMVFAAVSVEIAWNIVSWAWKKYVKKEKDYDGN